MDGFPYSDKTTAIDLYSHVYHVVLLCECIATAVEAIASSSPTCSTEFKCYGTLSFGSTCTVEPLNNGHIGTDHFVHYREVVLFQR